MNIFSDKDSHAFIRESKRMGTCDPKDDQERSQSERTCSLLRMTAKGKEFLDVNPRIKIDHRESCLTNVFHVLSMKKTKKPFRALFNEFLSCTPYEENF